MKIRNMRVNHLKNPWDMSVNIRSFPGLYKCKRKAAGKGQNGNRPGSGNEKGGLRQRLETGDQQRGFCPNVQISPRTRYYWRIKVLTDRREKLTSPVSWFETGKDGGAVAGAVDQCGF